MLCISIKDNYILSMDVFKFNWTQRIKTEPFVNATLNSKRYTDKPKGVRYWRQIPGQQNIQSWNAARRTYLMSKIYTHEGSRRKYGLHTTPIRNYDIVKRNVKDRNPPALQNIEIVSDSIKDPDAWENTRPQSLYNLHYASLR